MRYRFLLMFILLFSLLPAVKAQAVVTDLLGRINTLRAGRGLAPYTLDPALTAAAQNHAQWMASTGEVSHIQSDGSRPRDRAAAAGYQSAWVSENIYMGGLATADDAWNFWINSSIHYAGLTSVNYVHIGIAMAQSAHGQAFVLVFGATGGSSGAAAPPSSGAGSSNNAPAAPPSYVVGVDEHGNIMHEVQEGDTLGNILLIYGYTWDDLPALLALNNMAEEDIRGLDIGAIVLVPPQAGTYTPEPQPTSSVTEAGPLPQNTPPASLEPTSQGGLLPLPAGAAPSTAPTMLTPTASATASPTIQHGIIISTLPPAASATAQPSEDTLPAAASDDQRGVPLWLIGAIGLQMGVLAYAAFEFFRRLWYRH